MATKHQLQHYLFNNPNKAQLAPVVTNLEITTFRLQHIQVSYVFYTSLNVGYIICLKYYRTYIMTDLVWNLQQAST